MPTKKEIKETKQYLKDKYDVKVDLLLDISEDDSNWIKQAKKNKKDDKKSTS